MTWFQPLLRLLVLALFLGMGADAALAQRVIRIIVPFAPGAVQDTMGRTFSNELGQALGATVIVENRAGAGGTLGSAFVAQSEPDGNTLLLAGASHTLAGQLHSKLPYHPIKDFVGVSYLGRSGFVVAAPGHLNVASLADYVKLIQSKPGQFNYASAGNGSATHMGMAYFLSQAGLDMQHIPMKSTAEAVNEVLAGRTHGVITSLIGMASFKGDERLKPLAYTGAQRSKFMPELPTVAEAGLAGFQFDSWAGLLAPAGTPSAEVDRINNAVIKVMANPAVQERFKRLGVETGTMAPHMFQKLLRADWDKAGQLLRVSGVKLD
jgi:tripartite-type tricarboxylate transporter receptor subunit TctC